MNVLIMIDEGVSVKDDEDIVVMIDGGVLIRIVIGLLIKYALTAYMCLSLMCVTVLLKQYVNSQMYWYL